MNYLWQPTCSSFAQMAANITVMPGLNPVDLSAVGRVAGDFGWVVEEAHDLPEVAAAWATRNTVAVLLSRDALGSGYGWLDTIELLNLALPGVRLIVCHGFS